MLLGDKLTIIKTFKASQCDKTVVFLKEQSMKHFCSGIRFDYYWSYVY